MSIICDLADGTDPLNGDIMKAVGNIEAERLDHTSFKECERVALCAIMVLQCPHKNALTLKRGSTIGMTHFCDFLALAVLVSDPGDVEELKAELESMGILTCYPAEARMATELIRSWCESFANLIRSNEYQSFERRAALRKYIKTEMLKKWEKLKTPISDKEVVKRM